jgi:hypothetical protein
VEKQKTRGKTKNPWKNKKPVEKQKTHGKTKNLWKNKKTHRKCLFKEQIYMC